MESTAEAILKGDPESAHVMKQGIKAKIQEFLPGQDK